jgi:hypothetical protein
VVDLTVRAISPDQHKAVMRYSDVVAYAETSNWSKKSEGAGAPVSRAKRGVASPEYVSSVAPPPGSPAREPRD